MATSVNEILHFIHSYIINNNFILKSHPLLNQKDNEFGYPLNLRGVNSPIFEQLFNIFPTSIDCGDTDMVF